MKKRLVFVVTLLLVGCAKKTMDAPHSLQQGTETHGGDLLVAQAKSLAYRLLGEEKEVRSIREQIAMTPTFSEEVISNQSLLTRTVPRQHWVINRARFVKQNGSRNDNMKRVVLQMIAEAAALVGAELRNYDHWDYALRGLSQDSVSSSEALLLFSEMADKSISRIDYCSQYHLASERADTISSQYTELLSQLNHLKHLIPVIPFNASGVRLYDAEFGYELDAEAVLKGERGEIRVNLSRLRESDLELSGLEMLAFHEYSHFLKLSSRDYHYLFTYLATKCL